MNIFFCHGVKVAVKQEQYAHTCRMKVLQKYPFADLIEIKIPGNSKSDVEYVQIADCMQRADMVVFVDNWHDYNRCKIAHLIATLYDFPIDYITTKETLRPIFKDFEIEQIRHDLKAGTAVSEIAEQYGIDIPNTLNGSTIFSEQRI